MVEDLILGTVLDEYILEERCGQGQIGSVYRATRKGAIEDERAIKFIKIDGLREGWQNEINKVTQLATTEGVVPYLANGNTEIGADSYVWIAWKYISGSSLRKYIENQEVTIPLLCDVVARVLSVLHACQSRNLQHGDLHSGNIIVESPSDLNLDPNLRRVWVTDFGYLTSSMGREMLDDFSGLSAIIKECLDVINFHELEGEDKEVYSALKQTFLRLLAETDATQGDYVRSARNLFKAFGEIKSGKPDEDRAENRKVGDYLAAETLGMRFDEWETLFVPKFIGSESLLSRNICVLTGLRGCGKTMVFRRLTGLFDHYLGPAAIRGSDSFIGFYLNARTIAEAFPWLPPEKERDALEQILHFFHTSWICEMLDWLSCVFEDNSNSTSWLVCFFDEYFPSGDFAPAQTSSTIQHLKTFFAGERRRSRLTSVYCQKTWPLSDLDFLDRFCSCLRSNMSNLGDKMFFFFLDDYSTPLVTGTAQHILNSVVFRRSSELVFKVATESVESIELVGLHGKSLEQEDDYLLIDSASELLQRSRTQNFQLLSELLGPRIQRDSRVSNSPTTLSTFLGSHNFSNTKLALQLKGSSQDVKKRILYHGTDVFTYMWSSNTREIISILAELLDRAIVPSVNGQDSLTVSPNDQNTVFRSAGAKFRNLLASATDPTKRLYEMPNSDRTYGEHLQRIADAFHEIADHELQTKTSKNQNLNPPKQARRIEITDVSKDLPNELQAFYRGLVRYGVFIRDSRGKSARGKAVPRLILRGVLIPYYTLSFSKRDSVSLEWDEFCEFLRTPKAFAKKWIENNLENGGGDQPDLPGLAN